MLKLGSFRVRIIDVYAPNSDSPSYFNEISDQVIHTRCDYVLVCGDLILLHLKNPQAPTYLISAMAELNFNRNPNKKRYTWQRRNPIKQARLDYFIGSCF